MGRTTASLNTIHTANNVDSQTTTSSFEFEAKSFLTRKPSNRRGELPQIHRRTRRKPQPFRGLSNEIFTLQRVEASVDFNIEHLKKRSQEVRNTV